MLRSSLSCLPLCPPSTLPSIVLCTRKQTQYQSRALCHTRTKLSEVTNLEPLPFQPADRFFHSVMPYGSNYGNRIVVVQERQYLPSSSYSVGSSASRSSGTASRYCSSMMDSRSSCSHSPSASGAGPDPTGTYRNGSSGMSTTPSRDWHFDADIVLKEGYVTTVTLNTKGKRAVVIVQENRSHSDANAPRSSERWRA